MNQFIRYEPRLQQWIVPSVNPPNMVSTAASANYSSPMVIVNFALIMVIIVLVILNINLMINILQNLSYVLLHIVSLLNPMLQPMDILMKNTLLKNGSTITIHLHSLDSNYLIKIFYPISPFNPSSEIAPKN